MVHIEKCNDCCVWMDAGVLSYKRCDRNFDCEHCPLDRVLQTEVPDTAPRAENNYEHVTAPLPDGTGGNAAAILSPYASAVLHRDFKYTDEHLWVQTLPGGYYRVGLDAWALRLLPDATDVITLASGSAVPEAGPMGWIYMDGETHTMRAPVTGMIVRRNSSVNRVNKAVRDSAYSESWLAVIKASDESDPGAGRCSGFGDAAERVRSEMEAFLAQTAHVLKDEEHLGICMNDGGEAIDSLEEALGAQRYREIVRDVLHLK